MSIIDIDNLRDPKNRTFLEFLQHENFSFTISRKETFGLPYWSVKIDKASMNAEILAGKKINDIPAFTHELLHIIEEINGQESHVMLPLIIQMSNSGFKQILRQDLVTHINNVILHEKMLSKFINAGFPINKFLFDFYVKPRFIIKKSTFELVKKKKIYLTNFSSFLWYYFTYSFHPNNHVRKYYNTILISQYNNSYPDLLNDLNAICSDWRNDNNYSNSNFMTNLLNTLDAWKLRHQYV